MKKKNVGGTDFVYINWLSLLLGAILWTLEKKKVSESSNAIVLSKQQNTYNNIFDVSEMHKTTTLYYYYKPFLLLIFYSSRFLRSYTHNWNDYFLFSVRPTLHYGVLWSRIGTLKNEICISLFRLKIHAEIKWNVVVINIFFLTDIAIAIIIIIIIIIITVIDVILLLYF